MEDCYFGCFRLISNSKGCLGLMTGQPIWVFGIAIIVIVRWFHFIYWRDMNKSIYYRLFRSTSRKSQYFGWYGILWGLGVDIGEVKFQLWRMWLRFDEHLGGWFQGKGFMRGCKNCKLCWVFAWWISEVKDCDLPRVLEINLFGGNGNWSSWTIGDYGYNAYVIIPNFHYDQRHNDMICVKLYSLKRSCPY